MARTQDITEGWGGARRGFPCSFRPNRSGITIVEIVVVIAIVGVLLALTIPAVQRARAAAARTQCQNNLMSLSRASLAFYDVRGVFPRNTVRPRGVTRVDGEPTGNLNRWSNGSYESWPRQIVTFLGHEASKTQDAIPAFGCPADPRGPTYSIPTYGFCWYAGVYSRRSYLNDGIIIDDSTFNRAKTVTREDVGDGLSNTILFAERPPSADGQKGWWDSPWAGDVISPALGDRSPISSSEFGNCPEIATFREGNYRDRCFFNAIWSNHPVAGNFAFGDGSVRTITYSAANRSAGDQSIVEALASRNRQEAVAPPGD
jgi:prepilin-type processing-associated H-X9-DG protein